MKNEDNEIEQVSSELVLPPDASLALVAERLVDQAKHDGVALTGEGGLLTGLVQQVLQSALETEMTDHLGYEQHSSDGWGSGNSRNGHYPKTVATEISDVRVDVPRDRNGSFEPQTVPVGTRPLSGLDEQIISLYAKGLTTGDIAAHLFDVFAKNIDRSTISRITDGIVDDMESWQSRPLDAAWFLTMVANRLSSFPLCHELAGSAVAKTKTGSIVQFGLDPLHLSLADSA